MANALILAPLPIVNATASTTSRGTALNVANDFAGVVWRSASVSGGDAGLLLDLGRDMPVDTVLLLGVDGDHLDAARVNVFLGTDAQGATFNGSVTGSGQGAGNYWVTPDYAVLTGGRRGDSSKGSTLVSWSAGPPLAVRYVYLYVSGLTSAGSVQIARAVVGKRFVPARNFKFGAGFGVKDLGKVDFSRLGVPLRNRGAKLRTASLTFSALGRDEVEQVTRPLLGRIGNTEFVAIVTDPDVAPDFPNRCYFGPIVGDNPGHVWRNAAGWEAPFNIVSAF